MPSRVRGTKKHVAEKHVADASVAEASAEEAPLEEVPVDETPIAEAPAAEPLVAESPIAELPVEEAPVAEAPVEEEPVAEAPLAEAPVAEPPAAEPLVAEPPLSELPVPESPVPELPVPALHAAETHVPQNKRSLTKMSTQETTPSYAELTTEGITLFVDAVAAANQRALDYTKSIWQILSKPYSAKAVDGAVRENFDRLNQLVSLTIGELQANGQKTADFAEKLVAHGAKVQESYVHALRGIVDTSVSNLTYVKDVAEKQLEDAGKRFEELRPQTKEEVSVN